MPNSLTGQSRHHGRNCLKRRPRATKLGARTGDANYLVLTLAAAISSQQAHPIQELGNRDKKADQVS